MASLDDEQILNSSSEKDIISTREDDEVSYIAPEGGKDGWFTLAGAWLILVATFGYLYSFGVYQDYYTRFFLSNHSPSKIAWIGSFQLTMPFILGIVSGKLFDAGYFHAVEIAGSTIFVVALFLSSFARPQKYFEVFLSQGLGMGVGAGLTFIATVSISVHHFRQRKALSTGIIMSGSSIGAIIYPIMINKLLPTIGFARSVRVSAYTVLGLLVLGNCLVRTAYHKNKDSGPPVRIRSFFSDTPYILAILGALVALFGFYFPLIYLQLYAINHGINTNLAFYSIAILNASSTFGRLFGNYLADIYGTFTILVPCTAITAASIFSIFAINNSGSLIAISIFHGFFAGAWLSLSVACLASSARHPSEVGARTGLAFALISFGTLGAAPVQGSLLTSNFNWNAPIIFSGIFMSASAIIFGITRKLLIKERKTQSV